MKLIQLQHYQNNYRKALVKWLYLVRKFHIEFTKPIIILFLFAFILKLVPNLFQEKTGKFFRNLLETVSLKKIMTWNNNDSKF
jgi:hypothetical protein